MVWKNNILRLFVAYWPFTEPSVGDFSRRMHLCKQAEVDAWVEAKTRQCCEIIYTWVSTEDTACLAVLQPVSDTRSGSQEVKIIYNVKREDAVDKSTLSM